MLPDRLDRAELMVDSGDRLLKLRVEHGPVGYHDYARKDRNVLFIKEGREPVRRPRDRIRLARARAVLNEVVVARPVFRHVRERLADRVELMKARKNEPLLLFRLFGSVRQNLLLLFDLKVNELLQNIRHTVARKDVFPEIRRRISVRVRRIARAPVPARALAPLIERQKERLLPFKPRRRPDFRMIDRKITQDPLVEQETDLPGITVIHPLPLSVINSLPSVLILQLKRKYWNAVQNEYHVNAVLIGGTVIPLPITGGMIAGILYRSCLIQ